MFDGPGGSGCDRVHFPVDSGWSSRDISMSGM
jgi:hypothetical protein